MGKRMFRGLFNPYVCLPIIAVLDMCLLPSYADTVYLKNGRKISGDLVSQTSANITLDIGSGDLVVDRSDIRDIRTTKNLSQAKNMSLVEKINARYYNLNDLGVRSIGLKFNVSTESKLLMDLSEERGADFAERIEDIDVRVDYSPADDALEITVLNKPCFDDEILEDITNSIVEGKKGMAEGFINTWKQYVTGIIDTDIGRITLLKFDGDDVVVALMDQERNERKLFFNKEHDLLFWEGTDAEGKEIYMERPRFMRAGNMLLVSGLRGEFGGPVGGFDISYQTINGVKVPREVFFYTGSEEFPDVTMFFSEAEVVF